MSTILCKLRLTKVSVEREDIALTAQYTQFIAEASHRLAELLLAELPAAHLEQVHLSDRKAAQILRLVGREAMRQLLARLAAQVTAEAQEAGYKVERRPVIRVEVLFGPIQLTSPYLVRDGCGLRPVRERLKVRHATRTPAVERALSDFGAEESFAQAATRFQEHYGWEIGASTVLRVVEGVATEAEQYLSQRLARERPLYELPAAERRGVAELLVELDGCEIRTVQCGREVVAETNECKRTRATAWKEVRVGLSGRIESARRTFVAKLGSYPEVCHDLFSAAIHEGLSPRTQVVAVADGGQGLREELATQFPRLQFILDKPHLVSHLYETAEALKLGERQRRRWVAEKMERISAGQVVAVIKGLKRKRAKCERVRCLVEYLTRFQDAVSYDEYKARGYPIGSGEVESAHRYIPQKRLKIAGASWKPETINAMLGLRVIRANQWWAEFWQQREEQLLAA